MPLQSPEADRCIAFVKKVVAEATREHLTALTPENAIEAIKKNIHTILQEPSGRCVDLLLNFAVEGETVVPGDAYTAYVTTMIQMGVPREEIVAKLPYLRVHKYSTRVQLEHFALAWDPAKKGSVTMQPVQAVEHIKVTFEIAKEDKPCQA